MTRGAGGALALAVAALLVCCSADPHQEQDGRSNQHSIMDQYNSNAYKERQELQDFLRFLMQVENVERTTGGLGGSSLLGRNVDGLGGSSLLGRNIGLGGSSLLGRGLNGLNSGLGGSSLTGRNLDNLGGSSLLGRNLGNLGGSSLLGRNLGNLGGSSLLGRETEASRFARFIDPLGGGNFVRNLDSIGGGNLVRNLDSLGGGNLVKKNLDQLGGPNLVKRTLDSLGGGNLVRNLDSIGGGHKTRNLDPLGGGHLTREVRAARHYADPLPYLAARRMYGKQEPWPGAALTNNFGFTKRNFDEIDRSDLNTFMGKRNFDEIDQTSMPFPYATKRFYHLYGNYLDYPVEHLRSGFDKKRLRAEYPMDEIDLSHFPIGSKRSQDDPADLAAKEKQSNDGLPPRKLRFDEIDNSYFPIG